MRKNPYAAGSRSCRASQRTGWGGLVTPAASRRQRASPAPLETSAADRCYLGGKQARAAAASCSSGWQKRRPREHHQCKTGRRRQLYESRVLGGNGTLRRRQITAGQLTRALCQASTGAAELDRTNKATHKRRATHARAHTYTHNGARAEGGAYVSESVRPRNANWKT